MSSATPSSDGFYYTTVTFNIGCAWQGANEFYIIPPAGMVFGTYLDNWTFSPAYYGASSYKTISSGLISIYLDQGSASFSVKVFFSGDNDLLMTTFALRVMANAGAGSGDCTFSSNVAGVTYVNGYYSGIPIGICVHPYISGSTNVCYGSNTTLTANAGASGSFNYLWSTGETSQSISAGSPGYPYYVTVTPTGSSCSRTSSTVYLNIGFGSVTASGDFCSQYYMQLDAGPGYNYQWSSGQTYSSIYAYSEGPYVVNYTNFNGCPVFAGYYVSCYNGGYRMALTTPKVKPNAELLLAPTLFANPAINFNSLRTQSDLLKPTFNLTANQNAQADQKPENELSSRMTHYPNPANRELTIQLPEIAQAPVPVKLYDQLGKMVHSTVVPTGQSSLNINTSDFTNGMYLLQIASDKDAFKKVMIVHEQ